MPKRYTVTITKANTRQNMWYNSKVGRSFITQLSIAENTSGNFVPVFKCYHIYPNHCKIVKEEEV